jgi:hypothetical protein
MWQRVDGPVLCVQTHCMKSVGCRIPPHPAPKPSSAELRSACRINELVAAFSPEGRIAAPKGVYRFRTLEEANRMEAEWLADWMARMSNERRK